MATGIPSNSSTVTPPINSVSDSSQVMMRSHWLIVVILSYSWWCGAEVDAYAYAAEIASSRSSRGPIANRYMRKINSTASKKNVIGIGASSHHSGMISVLIESAPLAKLAAATRAPYQTK